VASRWVKSRRLWLRKRGGNAVCLAVPGRIIDITDTQATTRRGNVSFGGITKEVNLSFVPEAEAGDYVLVHVGFALTKIQEDEARRVLEYLDEMDGLSELEEGDA
jgi:hydrogenase expression/formation protein HypC